MDFHRLLASWSFSHHSRGMRFIQRHWKENLLMQPQSISLIYLAGQDYENNSLSTWKQDILMSSGWASNFVSQTNCSCRSGGVTHESGLPPFWDLSGWDQAPSHDWAVNYIGHPQARMQTMETPPESQMASLRWRPISWNPHESESKLYAKLPCKLTDHYMVRHPPRHCHTVATLYRKGSGHQAYRGSAEFVRSLRWPKHEIIIEKLHGNDGILRCGESWQIGKRMGCTCLYNFHYRHIYIYIYVCVPVCYKYIRYRYNMI